MAVKLEGPPGFVRVAPVRTVNHPEGTVYLTPTLTLLSSTVSMRTVRVKYPKVAFDNPSNCP